MGEFKEIIKIDYIKIVDNEIKIMIDDLLKELENKTDIKEYIEHIENRRIELHKFMDNFDYNINKIKESKVTYKKDNDRSTAMLIDNILSRKIENAINELKEKILKIKGFNTYTVLNQIDNRKEVITNLLKNFKENMDIINKPVINELRIVDPIR